MTQNKEEIQKALTVGAKTILKHKKELTDKLTNDKIATNCISYVWDDKNAYHIVSNIIPNVNLGYGGTEGGWYGGGPTRLIYKANYALRSTFTIPQVPLTSGWLNGMSTEFDNLVGVLSKDYSKKDPKVEFKESTPYVNKNSSEKRESMLLASGSLDVNSRGTHTDVMISNIQKNGRNYFGDVSVHMVRLFGTGSSFYPMKNKFSEEDTDIYHSLKTQDLYNPKTETAKPTSQIFKQKLNSELDAFSKKANEYKGVIEQTTNKKLSMNEYHMLTVYHF